MSAAAPADAAARVAFAESACEDTAPKQYFRGTHRTCVPEETLMRLQPLLPQLGITRIANVTGLDRTGIPVVMVCRPNARSVAVSQGKGLTLAAAKVSGVMEALEVWHAERVAKPLKLASYAELRCDHHTVDVSKLPRARESRFSSSLVTLWIEGSDLIGGATAWLPFELVSANYTLPFPPGSGSFQANTNGLGSGNHRLEAVNHALCEVVERDAVTLWKQSPVREQAARAIDPDTIVDDDCTALLERFTASGLRVRVWDATSDVGLASFVCLLLGATDDDADPEFGAGCHPSRRVALLRALTEAAQARNTYIAGARDDYSSRLYQSGQRTSRRAHCESLFKDSTPRRSFLYVPDYESQSMDADLRRILARLRAAGIEEAIVVDLARESVGFPVVRVVVPGLEGSMSGRDYSPGARARRHVWGTA